MLNSFLNLFRLERPLYRWREHPSLSAFMMNFERKFKPKMFRIRIIKTVRFWSVVAMIISLILTILTFFSNPSAKMNSMGLIFYFFFIFILLFAVFTCISVVTAFLDRNIALFNKFVHIGEDNVSWKYQEFEYFAFTQMIYPSNGASYPCLVLVNRDQKYITVGMPNHEVALRVTEILSSRMTFRTDFEPIMLEDIKT